MLLTLGCAAGRRCACACEGWGAAGLAGWQAHRVWSCGPRVSRCRCLRLPTHPSPSSPSPSMACSCGKFRFYDHDFGMLPGTALPRMVSGCSGRGGGAGRRLRRRRKTGPRCSPPRPPPPLLQLDMGQCNDAYSAIVVASKLAEVRRPGSGSGRGGEAPIGRPCKGAQGGTAHITSTTPFAHVCRCLAPTSMACR